MENTPQPHLLLVLCVIAVLVQSVPIIAASNAYANCSLSMQGFGYNVQQGIASLKLHCTTSDSKPLLVGINSSWIDSSNSDLKGVAVAAKPLPCQQAEQSYGNCALLYFCDSRYTTVLQHPNISDVWWDDGGGSDPGCWSNIMHLGPNTTVRIVRGNFSYNANIAGSVISVSGGNPSISNSLFLNNTCGYGAAALWAYKGSHLLLHESTFDRNSAYGAASTIGGQCTLSQCNFGGAVLIDGCNATISNCNMSYNKVEGAGATAAALAAMNARVTITGSKFSRNSAAGYGGACWFSDSYVSIYDSLFDSNNATSDGVGGAIGLSNSSVEMSACNLTGNIGVVEGGAIALWEGASHLHASQCRFVNNVAGNGVSSIGGAVFADVDSAMVFSNCTAVGNQAAYGGFMYLTNVSTVDINGGTVLTNNSAFVAGGAIWASGRALVNVSGGTTCMLNRAGTAGGDIVVLGGGGGIGINQSARAYLSQSRFTSNSAAEDCAGGGAVLVRHFGRVSVIDSVLSNNSAASGGAIRTHGVATVLVVQGSVVSHNYASIHGGGLHIIDGRVRVTGRSEIVHNVAGSQGGGLRLLTPAFVVPELLAATEHNKAFHDNDLSVPVANISVAKASPNKPGQVSSLLADGSMLYVMNVTGYHGLPCGGVTLAASIQDVADQKVETVVLNASDASGGVILRITIPPGSYLADVTMDGNTSVRTTFPVHHSGCDLGQIVGRGGLCQMCLEGSYSLGQNSAQCFPCPRGANCSGGAVLVPEASYWRSSFLSDQVHRCPNAAACRGWQSNNQSTLATCTEVLVQQYSTCSGNSHEAACNNGGPASCGASNITPSDALCSPGYFGNLCGECSAGYGSSKPFTCRQCMSRNTMVALYAVGAVLLLCLIKTLCYFTLRQTASATALTDGGSQPAVPATDLLKPLVLYCQYLLIIVGTSSIEWPAAFAYPFKGVAWVFSASSPETLSPDCLFAGKHLPSGLVKTLFYLVTPLAMMVAVLLLEACLHALHIRSRKTAGVSAVDRLVSTGMVVLFFFLPSLVRTTLALFACAQIDKLGSSSSNAGLAAVGRFWLLDLNQPCFQGYHRVWALALGVPLTVLVCIALPMAIFCLTVHSRKRHLYSPNVQHNFTFLYKSYKPSRSFWEVCVTFQTTILVAITVFGHSFGSYFQLLLMTFVLVLFWFTLSVARPYQHRVAQRVMEYGMVCLFTTSFAALTLLADGYVQDGSTNAAYKLAAGVILTCLNGSFVLYVFYQLCRTLPWKSVMSGLRAVSQRLCGRIDKKGKADQVAHSHQGKVNIHPLGPPLEVLPSNKARGGVRKQLALKETVFGPVITGEYSQEYYDC